MNLHFKARELEDGYTMVASPQNSPLRWQTFGLLALRGQGKRYDGRLENEEAVLTLLSGQGVVEIQERSGRTDRYDIGPREDPFVDRATVVYLPPGTAYQVTSVSPEFKATLHCAPASQEGNAFLIHPNSLTPVSTGIGNWRRDVCLCTPIDQPIQRFILGETINPPGNWSSYPPHKHDEDKPPFEAPYEEIYHFMVKPRQGFGFIRVYDPPERPDRMDEAFVIEDGDTVVLPKGYHPLAVAPGYQLYYLFALVGDKRVYGAWSDDPDHQWVRACEAVVKG
jgi:5-deoxy-glucuronate isomerase